METELTTTTFSYEEIDPETRISLKQRASRIGERTRRMATDIWENGREFAEAQQELASYGNGRFLAWVETEVGYSKSTVYRMIDVHQRLDFPKLGRTDIAASALYLLASASTPDEARDEIMGAAEQGEAISYSRAKDAVQAHKPEKHWGLSNGMAFWREVEKLRIDKSKVLDFLQPGATHLTDLEMDKREAFDRLVYAPLEPVTAVPELTAGNSGIIVGGDWNKRPCEIIETNPAQGSVLVEFADSDGSSARSWLNASQVKPAPAVPNEEQTAAPDDYNYADELQKSIEAAETAAVSLSPMKIWEIEYYVRAWVASDSPGKAGFSEPINALRNVKHKFGGWRVVFDSIKATMERPFNDGDLRQAVNNVIAQEEAGKRDVLNGEQTAVPTKSYCKWWKCPSGNNRFTVPGDTMICTTCGAQHEEGFAGTRLAPGEHERLEQSLRESNPPMLKQVLQEVNHYETEMETFSRHHKLTTAIHTIETLAADKTLGIDVVGPLARALGPLYDAQKALRETAVSQEVSA